MMLASRVHDLDEVPGHIRGEMFIEYKYDGERVQIHRDGNGDVHAFSRRLERIAHQYPRLSTRLPGPPSQKYHSRGGDRRLRFQGGPFLPFQTLMQRRRKRDVPTYIKKVTIALFAFDLLLV